MPFLNALGILCFFFVFLLNIYNFYSKTISFKLTVIHEKGLTSSVV